MIDQWIKNALCGGDEVVINFTNGAFFYAKREVSARIKYNTIDCVWFDYIDGEYQVSLIHTHDDIQWIASSED